ncbi:MAG: GNAT family N-acetyltransferase [Synechococcales cyanobacterium C42_A2020_086]|jgi:GNAT superfamily N-acetyltransferase|nr:GNAT family N-acetyltransferase [Synechococcales cyanobacterium C42_A2020_086]
MTIRSAQAADISVILKLIRQKAAFDDAMNACDNPLEATAERLQRTLFSGVHSGDVAPFAYVLLAEADTELAPQVIGFALYSFRYSSFRAQPSLWLDDLFVVASQRRQGIGTALLQRLIEIAQYQECSHLAWTACVDNVPGVRFYQKHGAKIVDQRQRRLYFRLPVSYSNFVAIPSSGSQGSTAYGSS